MKTTYSQIKAKFISFCEKFYPPEIYNEKVPKLMDDLYYLRSKVLHDSLSFHISNRTDSITFNRYSRSGEIEKRETKYLVRIPSYDFLTRTFSDMIIVFVQYLYQERGSKEDMKRYRPIDFEYRNIIRVKPIKTIKAHYIVRKKNIHREVDFLDLNSCRVRLYQILAQFDKDKDYYKALSQVEQIIILPEFSWEYLTHRMAVYTKLNLLIDTKRLTEFSETLSNYQISDIIPYTFPILNKYAYNLAYQKKFQEAHQTIDKILDVVQQTKDKANYLDSKGDFYRMNREYIEALTWYKESLCINPEHQSSLYQDTSQKLEECINQIKKGLNIQKS